MNVTYALDSTTVEATQQELAEHHTTLERVRAYEEGHGRRLVIKLEIHEATEIESAAHPRARLFPQPLQTLGAMLPVAVADRLRDYAKRRGQPLSDLTRVLWTEFLIARQRRTGKDFWADFIERRMDLVKDIRDRKKAVSYARTRVVQIHSKKASRPKKSPQKKQSRRK